MDFETAVSKYIQYEKTIQNQEKELKILKEKNEI